MELIKLYIEPTSRCNLDCPMCMRRTWEEPTGDMPDAVFGRILDDIRAFSPRPIVFFGGIGEPLLHPRIADMVARAKATGARTELITNGTLLTPELSLEILRAGLDFLWISLDGASSETHAVSRGGASLTTVIENIAGFREAILRGGGRGGCCGFIPNFNVQIGIEFVATKHNIGELPEMITLARRLGATRLLVSNILPYAPEMQREALYLEKLAGGDGLSVILPATDLAAIPAEAFGPAIGQGTLLPRCPFIEGGAMAVGWDGGVSPCLPLLHTHRTYLFDRERLAHRWILGKITERTLPDLWVLPEHVAFRKRVKAFEFPPCVACHCVLSARNEEDCLGNPFPTCGGCLWAYGFIRCP